MRTIFHHYIETIIAQMDGTPSEKTEIYDELNDHLLLTFEDYKKKGFSSKEAQQMAIQRFGNSKEIGHQMQEAMFPLRKMMLLILAIASLLYSFVFYVDQLFREGDALFGWLIISVATSSFLLFFALQYFSKLDRKSALNTALIVHIIIYLFSAFSSLFSMVAWLIILLSVTMIYRTTIFDYQYSSTGRQKSIKTFHFINLTLGIGFSIYTLFLLWSILVFSDTFEVWMLKMLIPISIWLFAYVAQLKLIQLGKTKTAYFIATIPFTLIVFLMMQLLRPTWIGVF